MFKRSAYARVAPWARPITFAGRVEVVARPSPKPGPTQRFVWRRTPSVLHLFTAGQLLALLFFCGKSAEAACIDPAALTHSTISVLGIRGTAWFLSETSIATAGHVASAMKLSQHTWKDIEILDGESTERIGVRVLHLAGAHFEKIAVLELRSAFPGGRSLKIRTEPLVPEEPVVSLAYPKNRLRFAGGRFVEYGGGEKFAGTALLELYDGDDRLVLDHGASGAPVLDCEGRVVALVSNLFTQTMQFFSQPIRISTAWGTANVVSVPIQVLKGTVKEE